jgi:hypothetical protein
MRTRNEIEISLIELSQEYKKKKTAISREITRLKEDARNAREALEKVVATRNEEMRAAIEKIRQDTEQRTAKSAAAADRLLAHINESILHGRADYEKAEEEYLEKKKALLKEMDSTDEVKPII